MLGTTRVHRRRSARGRIRGTETLIRGLSSFSRLSRVVRDLPRGIQGRSGNAAIIDVSRFSSLRSSLRRSRIRGFGRRGFSMSRRS